MKIKNVCIALGFILPIAANAQLDTNLYLTATSQNVATWLKNLSNPAGSGHVSISDWQMGTSLLKMNSRHYVDSAGMTSYYANTSLVNTDLNLAGQNLRRDFRMMQQASVNMARCPSFISWGFVEPSQGTYHYEFIDSTVSIAGRYGIKLLGTVIPLADWSQTCNPVNTSCGLFTNGDFYFLNNNKTGAVCPADTSYFYQFVQQTVERYDGDGINDMPGLTLPITVWEFSSEPESPCVNNTAPGYERDLDIFRRAMKAACPACQLLNGGWAGYMQDSAFWKTVIQDKHSDIDIANIHCNDGRTNAPFNFTKMLYNQTNLFQQQIDQFSPDWNIWLTEWGIYCGQPTSLPLRTEEEQASLYAKIYCWCAANNITNVFYDLRTPATSSVGSASLLQENPSPKDSLFARLFFYTQKLLEYEFRNCDSVRIVQMDTTTGLPGGDIRFYKAGNTYYVLWGLNNLPSGLSGVKKITDIYGNIQTANVTSLSLPLISLPIIIEDTSATTAANEMMPGPLKIIIYPNPVTSNLTIVTSQKSVAEILNTQSLTIMQQQVQQGRTDIDVSRLAKGMYILRLISDNKIETAGFIKE